METDYRNRVLAMSESSYIQREMRTEEFAEQVSHKVVVTVRHL